MVRRLKNDLLIAERGARVARFVWSIHGQRFAHFRVLCVLCSPRDSISSVFSVRRESSTPAASTTFLFSTFYMTISGAATADLSPRKSTISRALARMWQSVAPCVKVVGLLQSRPSLGGDRQGALGRKLLQKREATRSLSRGRLLCYLSQSPKKRIQ